MAFCQRQSPSLRNGTSKTKDLGFGNVAKFFSYCKGGVWVVEEMMELRDMINDRVDVIKESDEGRKRDLDFITAYEDVLDMIEEVLREHNEYIAYDGDFDEDTY